MKSALVATIAILTAGTAVATNPCIATPIVYGPVCTDDTGLVGSPGTYVTYDVTVVGSTQVLCKASGLAPLPGKLLEECKFGLYLIGTGGDAGPLLWDSSAGTPQISCYGNPLGSAITWEHVVHTGDISCCGAQGAPSYTFDQSNSFCCLAATKHPYEPYPDSKSYVCKGASVGVCCPWGDVNKNPWCCPAGSVCGGTLDYPLCLGSSDGETKILRGVFANSTNKTIGGKK